MHRFSFVSLMWQQKLLWSTSNEPQHFSVFELISHCQHLQSFSWKLPPKVQTAVLSVSKAGLKGLKMNPPTIFLPHGQPPSTDCWQGWYLTTPPLLRRRVTLRCVLHRLISFRNGSWLDTQPAFSRLTFSFTRGPWIPRQTH